MAESTQRESKWRPNMWVVVDGVSVGVLFSIGDLCEIHLVDDNGDNTKVIQRPLSSLRQAKYAEIPSKRMGISIQQARKLGYGS
jgi:hypothetical protein